jgi:hypothetical protein
MEVIQWWEEMKQGFTQSASIFTVKIMGCFGISVTSKKSNFQSLSSSMENLVLRCLE